MSRIGLACYISLLFSSAALAVPSIEVDLPKDRTKCGQLVLRNSVGKVVLGPLLACGVADLKAAKAHGNAQRSTLVPYGHTPTGGYRVMSIFKVGDSPTYNGGPACRRPSPNRRTVALPLCSQRP